MNELLKQEVLHYMGLLYQTLVIPKLEAETEEEYNIRERNFKNDLFNFISFSLDDFGQWEENFVLVFEYDNNSGIEINGTYIPAGICKDSGKYIGLLTSINSFKTVFCDQPFDYQKSLEIQYRYNKEILRSLLVQHAANKIQRFINDWQKSFTTD